MSKGNIVILTGAGISAESGLQTFRAADGLWCGHKVEEVATPEGFARNPALVQEFYNLRRAQLKEVQPNAAHDALAKLASEWEGTVTLVTQNVDDLHQRAASRVNHDRYRFYNMHGELKRIRCGYTERIFEWSEDITPQTPCECCRKTGTLRPHIVWFGEMPFFMDEIYAALDRCDLFISIGTSGNVYPAAGFIQYLGMKGQAHTVELNLEPSQGSHYFDENHFGPATKVVPEYVMRLLRT
ncbi:MAG: Sir2 family NAD+-dependent deacetylase [Rickettsiales bacterium]